MNNSLAALLVGFSFSLGLGLSGMTQPTKVIGFLDIFGNWDPSLMFVMVGAIGVHMLLYHLIRRRSSPLLAMHWHVPSKRELTPSLLIGSAIFGIGWGLAGFCPGPAITSLASLENEPLLFVLAMIGGMGAYRIFDKKFNLPR